MPFEEGLKKLKESRNRALEMGGAAKVEKQHNEGKLTVRERVDLLADKGTFREYGMLGTHQSHRPEMAGIFTAADGLITGFGLINGRRTCIIAEDFTVLAGSEGLTHMAKMTRTVEIATRETVPIVWMLDGAGARAQEFIAEGLPPSGHFLQVARHSGIAPQVAIVMGPCAGGSSLLAGQMEFIIMVKGTAMLAAGGPPVVFSATGEKISKEDLGGWKIHCRISNVADNPAENDEDAILKAKKYLSYLPNSAYEYPPILPTDDDRNRMDEELLHILPPGFKMSYDMKRIINCIVDKESFFEIKPFHAQEMIIGLARMNGQTVGIMANQPMVGAGAISANAGQKERHFIDLCASYHIPIISLVDVPGVQTGSASEKRSTLRYGLAVAYSLAWAQVPVITVVIRKGFGFGGVAMAGGHGLGQILTLAWPTADFGSLPPSGGVLAAYKSELEKSEDPLEAKKKLEEAFNKYKGPFPAASVFNVDDVIDPRETRPRIIDALELALEGRKKPATPLMRHGVMP